MPEVPSESTATALLPHRPRSMAQDMQCTPDMPRALGAEPTDPTLIGRTLKRRWHEGGTHRSLSLLSAESELGTLPFSVFLLRYLHTRSGLGPARRYYDAPTATMCFNGTRAQYPWDGVPLEYSVVTSRACPRSPLRLPQRPSCRTAPARWPQTCIPRHAARSEQSRLIRPLLGRTRANAVGKKGAHTGLKGW